MNSLNITSIVPTVHLTCHSNFHIPKPHPVIRQTTDGTLKTCIAGNIVSTPVCSKHHTTSCSCDLMSTVVGTCTHKHCPNK
jgi:hypothetical protein